MELKPFIKHIFEGIKKIEKHDISVLEPPLVTTADGDKYTGGRKLHNLPNALNHNGKNMFYSFDLTNKCNRGCPGCYVDRAKEISCNAVADIPLKEYKGDLRKWEEKAKTDPEYAKQLADAKKQINGNGGIRMFSAADYPDSTDPEYVQYMKKAKIDDPDFFKHQVTAFLDDAKATGWHVKAITKELKFLKDHIHHDALKGVDVSMNAQGFGESHNVVKAMRSGKHNDKSLSQAEKDKLGMHFDEKDAKTLAKHSDKIIGRTVTQTPFDLTKILEHKDDHSHIGVITSGHDIPGNGIRFVPSKPKQPFSPKTIIMQINFPEKLMHILNGVRKASIEETTAMLNKYADDYNKLRNKAKADIDKGRIEISDIKYQMPKNVQESSGEDDEDDLDQAEDNETGDNIKENARQVITLIREDGVWHQYVSYKGHLKPTDKAKASLIPNIEQQFDIINPVFTHKFTDQDTKFLLDKMAGKMCCAGQLKGKEAKGKCHNCDAKCGVKGCGSNVEKDASGKKAEKRDMSPEAQTDTLDDNVKESKFYKYLL